MADRVYVVADMSGGRNGVDAPFGPLFGPNQVVEAVNVDWYHSSGLRKRHGSEPMLMTGSVWTGQVVWLGRHVPGTNEADAELWGLDTHAPAGAFQRLDNSDVWSVPSGVGDNPVATGPWNVTSASLNGLFFIAYDSGADRLHCYDAAIDTIRRTGVWGGDTGPTVTDIFNVAGTITVPVLRYYRVRFGHNMPSGPLWAEATPSVSHIPAIDATNPKLLAVRITRPAPPAAENITMWRVEASQDGVSFFAIADLPIATTFLDDANDPAIYTATNFATAPLTGTHSLQKSYRFIAADNNRLLGFGNYFPTNKQARIEISAVVGSLDQGDAERVDTTSTWYYDLDEKDSGVPTALVGPLYGNFYAMKTRQLWELAPTGQVDNPYRVTAISKELGCVAANACCIGEDRQGEPCLYFMSHRGMCRYGLDGIKYVGRGIEDLARRMNMAATNSVCHMVWHADMRQLWVWFAIDIANDPNMLCVLDVVSGGWAQFTGSLARARCSVAFARSVGATMGFPLTPYIGSMVAPNRVVRCDVQSLDARDDDGQTYRGYVTTKPLEPAGAGYRGRLRDMQVLTAVGFALIGQPTLMAEVCVDFRTTPEKRPTVVLQQAVAGVAQYRYHLRVEDSEIGSVQFVQYTLGDPPAVLNDVGVVITPVQNALWMVDRFSLVVTPDADPAT